MCVPNPLSRLLAEAVAVAGVPGVGAGAPGTAGDPPTPGAYGASANATITGPLDETSFINVNVTPTPLPTPQRPVGPILPIIVAPPGQAEPSSGAGVGVATGPRSAAMALAAALAGAAALLL